MRPHGGGPTVSVLAGAGGNHYLQKSLHNFGFREVVETQVLPVENLRNEGTQDDGGSSRQGGHAAGFSRTRKVANQLWDSFTFVSYNVENLSYAKSSHILMQCSLNKIDAIALIGTRSTFSDDVEIPEYTTFNAPAASTSFDSYAGVSIFIHNRFLQKSMVKKIAHSASRNRC